MFTVKIVFSGEVNFRMSGRVNRRNVITGEQQSLCSDKLQRAIPSALSKQEFLGSLFLASVFTCVRNRGSVIGISTRVRGGRSGVRGPDGGKKFFQSPKLADRLYLYFSYAFVV
jgi:hypothetical protein